MAVNGIAFAVESSTRAAGASGPTRDVTWPRTASSSRDGARPALPGSRPSVAGEAPWS